MLEVGGTAPVWFGRWTLLNWYDLDPEHSCAPVVLGNIVRRRSDFTAAACSPVGVVYDGDAAEIVRLQYGVDILVDENRSLSEKFHAVRTDWYPDIPKRIAYLLDPDSVIVHAWGWLDPDFFIDDALTLLKALTQ